jgi:queuine tRNA-ribosyltransferase
MFTFEITDTAPGGARAGKLTTAHGAFSTPAFMPVGTAGAVKALTTGHLEQLGAEVVLANTYHLSLRPGTDRLINLGGLHRLMDWKRPLLTDSGGYQVLSLAGRRKIEPDGVEFASHLDGSRHKFTPARVLEIQRAIGSDLMMPLDICPSFEDPPEAVARATELTHRWAEEALGVWRAQPESVHGWPQTLFGIVQGGYTEEGRRQSAKIIGSLGFPGWAIGGLVTSEPRESTWKLLEAVTGTLPTSGPRYLMGVGTPADIVRAVARGVDMFDCVLPTRNARNGTVFTSRGVLQIKAARHAEDAAPMDPDCSCPVCARYSRAYIRHLLASNEITGLILTTMHSVHFYLDLMARIRKAISDHNFKSWAEGFLARYETDSAHPNLGKEVTA